MVSVMLDDLVVVNVVGTGRLSTNINYTEVIDDVELPAVQYDPAIHQGLELRFIEEGPLITVYSTGKYIIRADSFEKLNDTREKFLDLFQEIGVISVAEDEKFNINNVVCSGNIQRELCLEHLAPDLEQGEAKYDPQSFPGIRYKLHSFRETMLIFRTGKIVITGGQSFQNAKKVYRNVINEIDGLMDN